MSQTIENRIVEMQFENKQFESGVQESLSTLDRLKKALKFDDAAKNLQDFSRATKNFDLNGIGQAVEQVGDKFSTMRLVGIHALNNIVDAAMAAGSRLASALMAPLEQIKKGGWSRAMNIEEAKFQLKGLGVAWEDVSDDIDYAVSGTAFGLDAAAKACAQLSASSIKAGADMKAALRGISGVAAMGNTEYENIAQIFTKAAGNGRVMADELNRVSQYGLNASAATKDFFNLINKGIDGILEDEKDLEKFEKIPDDVKESVRELTKGLLVTESDIRDFASDSKISFRTFSYAMDSAFGEHAKKANETFMGSLRNIKAALSRTGQKFAEPLIQNAIPAFNKIREMVNAINGKTGLANMANAFGNLTRIISELFSNKIQRAIDFINNKSSVSINLYESLKNIVEALLRVAYAVKDAFRTVFPETKSFGDRINSLSDGIRKFTEFLIPSNETLIIFRTIMVAVFTVIKAVGSVIKAILPIVGKIIQFLAQGVSIVANIVAGLINFVSQLDLVNIASELFLGLINGLKAAFAYFKSILSDTTTVTGRFAANLKDTVVTIAGLVGGSLYLAFSKISEFVKNMVSSGDPLKYITDCFKNLIDTAKNIPIIGTVIGFLEKGFTSIKNVISEMRNSEGTLNAIISRVKDIAYLIGGTLLTAIMGVINLIRELVTTEHPIQLIVSKLKDLIVKFKELDFVKSIIEYIKNAFNGLISIFTPVEGAIGKVTECIKTFLGVTEKGEQVIEETHEMAKAYGNGGALSGVVQTLSKTGDTIEKTAETAIKSKKPIELLAKAWDLLKAKLQDFKAGNIILAIFAMRLVIFAYHTDQLIASLAGLANKLKGGIFSFFKTPISKFTRFAAAMGMIVASIGALALAFYKLKDIPVDQLKAIRDTFGALIGMSAGLAIVVGIVQKFSDGGNGFISFAAGLFALSGSIVVFIEALKSIDKLKLEHIGRDVAILASMIAGFIGITYILSFIPKFEVGALSMIALAGSLFILVKALDNLSKINFEAIKENWKEIIAVILGFAAMAAIASTVGLSSTIAMVIFLLSFNKVAAVFEQVKGVLSGIGLGDFILEFCSRLKNTIAQAVSHLEDVYKSMTDGEKTFSAIMIVLGSIGAIRGLIALSEITKNIRRIAFSALFVAGAIGILLYAYYKVAAACQDIKPGVLEQIKWAMLTIAGFIGILELLSGVLSGDSVIDTTSGWGRKKVKTHESHERSSFLKQTRKMLLDMGILIAAIALFMHVVGKLSDDEIARAVPILKQCLLFIGIITVACTIISSFAKGTRAGGAGFITFLGVIALLGSLLGAFVVLMNYFKDFDFEKNKAQLTAACIGLIVLVGAVSIILAALGSIKSAKAAVTLLAFAGVIAAFAYVVYQLTTNIKSEDLEKAGLIALGLVAALFAISLIAMMINKSFTKNKSGLGTATKILVVLVGFIAAIAVIAAAVAGLYMVIGDNQEAYLKAVAILGGLMAALFLITVFSTWLNKSFSKNNKSSWKAIAATMVSMVGSIIVIALAVVQLYKTLGTDPEVYKKCLYILIALLGTLAIIVALSVWLVNTLGNNAFATGGKVVAIMASMVGSIIAIAYTVYKVYDALDGNKDKMYKCVAILAVLLITVAVLVGLAIGIVDMMKEVTWGTLGKAVISLAVMLALFVILAAIFYKIDSEFSENVGQLYGKVFSIIAVMAALELLILGAIGLGKLIEHYPIESVFGGLAMVAFVAIFWWLEYVFSEIDKFGSSAKDLLKKSQTMILVIVELFAIVFIVGAIFSALVQSGIGILVLIGAAIGILAMGIMIEFFSMLTDVFTVIDGLKVEGIMKKSQTIILVMLELEVLGILSALCIGEYIGGYGLEKMIEFFDQLAEVFIKIDGIKAEGMFDKAWAIIKTLFCLEFLGALSIFDLFATIGQFGLGPMIDFFAQLADVFIKIAESPVDETTAIKADQIVDVLGRLEKLGVLSIADVLAFVGQIGLEPMVEFFAQLSVVFIKIAESPVDETTGQKAQDIINVLETLCSMSWSTLQGVIAKFGASGISSMIEIFDALTDVAAKIASSDIGSMNPELTKAAFGAIIDIMEDMSRVGNLGSIFKADMFSGLISAMEKLVGLSKDSSNVMQLADAVEKLTGLQQSLTDMANTIESTTTTISTAVSNLIDSMISAIDGRQGDIYTAGQNLVNKFGEGVESVDASTWGRHLVENFASGIDGNLGVVESAVSKVAQTVADYLEHTDPPKGPLAGGAEETWGQHVDQNFGQGINDGIGHVESAVSNVATSVQNGTKNMMDKVKDVAQSGTEKAMGAVNGAIDKGKQSVISAAGKVGKMAGDALGIDFENTVQPYINGIMSDLFGLSNYLSSISSAYKKGSGTLADAEYNYRTKITGLKKESDALQAQMKDFQKNGASDKDFDNLKNKIKENQDALEDTEKRLSSLGKKSADIDSLTEAIGEFTGGGGKGGGGVKGATNELAKFQEQLEGVLEGQMNIFQKFEKKEAMSKEELLENMRSQIRGMTEWAADMQKLAARGLDQGLYQELAMMGPQGAEYVGAFASMTAEELAEANNLWAQSLVLPKSVSTQLAGSFSGMGKDMMQGWANGITGNAVLASTAATNAGNTVTQAGANAVGVASPSWIFFEIGMYMMIGLANGIWKYKDIPERRLKSVCEGLIRGAKSALSQDKFYAIGLDVLKGLLAGLSDPEMSAKIAARLRELAADIEGGVSDPLERNSPSKVFMRIGRDLLRGLEIGIKDYSYLATDAIEESAESVIGTMKETIAKVSEYLNDEVEDPVIRPVLDLSNVQAGARTLNNLFSTNQALTASATLSSLQNEQLNQSRLGTTFIQNNYSPKALSRVEIYRQTKNQFSAYREAMQ